MNKERISENWSPESYSQACDIDYLLIYAIDQFERGLKYQTIETLKSIISKIREVKPKP